MININELNEMVNRLQRLSDELYKNRYPAESDLVDDAVDMIEKLATETPKWIDVKEKLPEKRISHLTKDSMYYPCIYQSRLTGEQEVRYYKFSKGHFWNCGEIVDNCVIAWSEPLLPPNAPKGR